MNKKEFVCADVFKKIGSVADKMEVECYVIGGFVRDSIMKRNEPKDIDIVCVGSGLELAENFAKTYPKSGKVSFFKNFGTAMLRFDGWEVEFVGARKESYDRGSRKPVCENGTLQDDQNRRDFTINALAISLNKKTFGNLLDPFNGMEDIATKLIRTPLDPDITFSDDPLRMFRAIRFASQLGFLIFTPSLESITRNKQRIKILSFERITEELNKIMLSKKPSVGLKLLYQTGLLEIILPELTALKSDKNIGHKDNLFHSFDVVDNISKNTNKLFLRYAALFHDIGKAPCKKYDEKLGWTFHNHEWVGGKKMLPKIFERLRLPLGAELKYVQKLIIMSSRPVSVTEEGTTDSAVRRLLFEASEEIDDLMTLCEADITTQNFNKKQQFLQNFYNLRERLAEVEQSDKLRQWQPPISGEEIMNTFKIPPCKEVGFIKTAIREAILDGKIENKYDAARDFMFEISKQYLG